MNVRLHDLQTQLPIHRLSSLRIVVASMMLLPAVVFSVLQLIAFPDLETWLKLQTGGFFRDDAFESVDRVSVLFATTLGVTCLLATYFVLSHRSNFLLPLSAGPSLMAVTYLATNGITDPEWFALLALASIGMLVGTPVTIAWALSAVRSSGDA